MRFACEPEERRVLVGGDPQPERHLLAVLFGRDACVVEAVEPLLRIAVLETEGEPLRLGVAREVEGRQRIAFVAERIAPPFACGQAVQPHPAHDARRDGGRVVGCRVVAVAHAEDQRRRCVRVSARFAERRGEQFVERHLLALLGRFGGRGVAPTSEARVVGGVEPCHGAVRVAVPPRPPVVDVERTVGAGDRRVAQDAVAPLPGGRRVVEFARRLDVDPFELFVGVEPQVEEMRQRPQQFRLPDLVPRHVVEGERRAVSGCRREAGAQPAPAADREVHPLLGAVETDLPEVFRRGRRHALGRGAHGDLHLGPARFADIPVVERPVLRVGDVDAGDVAVETCVDECRPLRRGEERRTGREVRQRRLRTVRRAAKRPSVALRVVEDDDPVLEGGAQRLPPVFEAVRQLEPHVRVFAQPHRVEARQARPRTDAVVGRVAEFVFEPHAHLRQRPEAEFALLDAQAASGAVCVGERDPRLVDLLRREGVDEVAHGVVRHEGVGLHPSQRIGRRRAVGLAPCQKPHLLLPDAGVVRGVGAAHVERAEPRALHEGAFDGVPRFGEECLHQCADRQEGVVVVGREQPLGRSEPRVAVLDFVAVAVYRQEFYGRVVAPPRGDLGRQ